MKLNDYLESLNELVFFKGPEVKGSFEYNLQWYENRHPKHRLYFYISGLLTSVSLVVLYCLNSSPELGKIVSILLLFVSSISSLFAFKRSWSGYYIASQNLLALKDIYDESLLRAKLINDEDEVQALKIAIASTTQFMTAANKVVNNETVDYFSAVKLPDFPSKN
ncbi:hypothetical protein ACT0HV_000043 [Vibrio diabolicus]